MISVGWRRGTSRNRYSKASCKRRFLVVLTVAAVVTAGLATTPATQPANAATTLGGILNGASNGDDYGHDTALSADGTRLVVGVPGDDTVASDAGLVRVFDWDGASWNQIGPDLTLGDPDDRFGYAVDITRDGTSVIVGAPGAIGGLGGSVAVYRIDGSTWTQVGSTIDGIWEFGSEVAISDDGNRIAASNLEDEVDAFRFTDGFWTQLGTTIGGGAPPGEISLSANGHVLAVGDPNWNQDGLVKLYEWQGQTWDHVETFNGGPGFGSSVALAASGRHLVVGDPEANSGDGEVIVYWKAWRDSWQQLGATAAGETGEGLGTSVAISSNGARLAVGAPGANNGEGRTRVLEWTGDSYDDTTLEWVDIDDPVTGQVAGERQGTAVALSGDGGTVSSSAIPSDDSAPGAVTNVEVSPLRVDPEGPIQLGLGMSDGAWRETVDCAMFSDGAARCSGYGAASWVGLPDGESPGTTWLPVDLGLTQGTTAIGVSSGNAHSCFLIDDGTVSCLWSDEGTTFGQWGPGGAGDPITFSSPAVKVDAGFNHTCVLSQDGSVSCWGRRGSGQVGDELGPGQSASAPNPVVVNLGTDRTALDIAIGGNFSCALLDNETIKCWGDNNDGQVGPGWSNTHEHSPVEVALGSHVPISLSAGGYHACAVTDEGELICWGSNWAGQLGRGTSGTGQWGAPSEVSLPNNALAEAVSLEKDSTCFLRTDAEVHCFGSSYNLTAPNQGDPIDFSPDNAANVTFSPILQPIDSLFSGTSKTCAVHDGELISCIHADRNVDLWPYANPGTVNNISASPGIGSVDLTWTPPLARGGAPIESYTATASPGDGTCTTSATQCTITGLDSTTAYTVTVTATNHYGTGEPSDPSGSVSPNGVPSAPTNIAVTTSNSQATISWDPPTFTGGSAISAYTVTTDPGAYTCTTTAASCTITDMAGGADFDFSVTATNDSGEGTASTAVTANVPSQFAVVASVDVGNWPAGIHFDGEHIWVTNNDESTINKIDINPSQIEATITAPGAQVAGVTSDADGNIWVAGSDVLKIDAGTAEITAEIDWVKGSPASGTDIEFDGATLWLMNGGTYGFQRISAPDGTAWGNGNFAVANPPSSSVAFDNSGHAWVTNTQYLSRIDMSSVNGARTDFASGWSNSRNVVFGPNGFLWVTDANGVDKVDPSDAAILEAVNLPGNPTEMAFDENGKLWVVQPDADTVTRIDPATATIEASVSVGDDPRAIVADDDGFVWVTVGGEDRVIRLSATPMSVADPPTSVSGSGGDGEVSVSWTAPADTGGTDVTGYTVTASPGGAQCATTGATSCTVTGLTNGTDYTFSATTENIVGSSDASMASDPVTPVGPPEPPTGLTATFGDGEVSVSWTAPADTGGTDVTGYTVTASPGGAQCATTGATSCTVTGLTNGTEYTFTATATNAVGESELSAPSDAATPATQPGPPQQIHTAIDDSQVTISWSAPASDGGHPITGYTVTASPGGNQCSTVGATSCTVAGLTNGTEYTFAVVAANDTGDGTPATSDPATPGIRPDPPTAVTGNYSSGQVTVTWTAPTSNGGSAITGYTVTATPDGAQCTTTGATSCTVTGLTNGTGYTFTVTAANEFGDSDASTASATVTPQTTPSAPSVPQATPGDGQVELTWSAPNSNGGSAITGYTATASPGGAQCTTTGATSCTITGLVNNTAYTFTVNATNAEGDGPASNPTAPIAPGFVPGAPTGVAITPSNGAITVTWTAPDSTGGSPITGYTATTSPGGAQCTTTGATSCTITGLTNGTSYTVTVTATNIVGTSEPSQTSASATPITVPSSPSSVSATADDGRATVSWTTPSDTGGSAVTSYTATASPGGATCASSSTACTIYGLENGTSYRFTVTASNAAGTSPASSRSNAVTPRGLPAPATGLRLKADGSLSFEIDSNGSSITGYSVTYQELDSPSGGWLSGVSQMNSALSEPGREIQPLVIGGEYPGINNHRHAVYIEMIDIVGSSTYVIGTCTGTIISDSWILTAAHCTEHQPYGFSYHDVDAYLIGYGAAAYDDMNWTYSLNARVHPNYNRTNLDNDLALVSLEDPVDLSIADRLPLYRWDELPDGSPAYAAGWGRTSQNGSSSDVLKGAYFETDNSCGSWETWHLEPTRICATAYPSSVCMGDSGGPLIVNRGGVTYHAGLTSFGRAGACASPSYPVQFTRTSSYLSWIEGITGSQRTSTYRSTTSDTPVASLSGISANRDYAVSIQIESNTGSSQEVTVRLRSTVGTATAPRNISVSPSGRSVSVSWTRPWLSGGDSSYTYRATASPGGRSCTTTGTSCTITGLDPLTSYSVSVTATNRAGRGPAGSATFTTSDSMVRSADEIGVDCNDAQPHPFTDIAPSHYSYGPAGCIYQLGVTTGTSATTYAPSNVVTRAQMAAFLARFYTIVTGLECSGNTPFADVPSGAYYTEAVGCIYQLGITTGTSSTTYSPGAVVTRAQMAAFLARLYSTLTETSCTGSHPFSDVAPTAYFSGPAGCIYNLGITTGTSATTYSPNNIVTRDQMAAFLARTYVSLTSS